jgi:tetratricopeptide (TPR) repeat protein
LRITGSLPDALNDGETALRSAAALGDAKEEIQSLLVLASIHSARADYTRTVQLSQQAFDRSTQIGEVGSQAVAMGTLGLAQWHIGALRKAAESLRRALVMHGSIGDSRGRATVLNYLGLTYYCLAQLEEALDANRESLEIKEALAIIPAIPGSLNNIGDTYREIGDSEKAMVYHRDALESARQQHNRGSECDSLRDLGTDFYRRGEFSVARSHFEEVLRLARTYGYAWSEIRVMLSLAELDLAENNTESADRWSEEGMRRSRETGAEQLALEAAWTRGKVFARLGNPPEARKLLAESVAKAEAMDHRLFLWQILREVVILERSSGDREAEEQAVTKVRTLLGEILGGFRNPDLRATFESMKEVRELLVAGT